VIGDAHAKPGVSNRRFTWAGKFAVEKQPDVIVDMGDWADMESLCSYDRGLKTYEGRRYLKDVKAACDARSLFNAPIEEYNQRQAESHRVRYKPLKVALGGNHDEGRISKAVESDPKLDGLIGVKDFEHAAFGWDYFPYLTPVGIAGFTFSHFFVSGVMGRPISGEMPSLQLIRKQFTSCVAAHSHLFDICHRTRPDGSRVWGLVAGCYLDSNQWENYANAANPLWWKGLVLLKGCSGGDVESIETITVQELERKYETRRA
jgi:hypothetical protein